MYDMDRCGNLVYVDSLHFYKSVLHCSRYWNISALVSDPVRISTTTNEQYSAERGVSGVSIVECGGLHCLN
jgi:hypothetical protein